MKDKGGGWKISEKNTLDIQVIEFENVDQVEIVRGGQFQYII